MAHPQTVTDLSNWAPPQRGVQGDDGELLIEKLSPLPGMMAVDPAGNVIPALPLSNGISNRLTTDPYRMQILAEKQAKGWVLVGRCPLSSGEALPHLPKSVRYHLDANGKPDESKPRNPCLAGINGGKINGSNHPDRFNPCVCIGLLEAARKERHNKRQGQNEDRTNRVHKMAEQAAQANLDATRSLAEAAKAFATVATARKDGGK